MKLEFPIHFQQRLIERNIDIDHIKKAIKKPDTTKGIFGGRFVSVKKIDKRTIKVVYSPVKGKKDTYVIITAYYIYKI